ISSFAVHFIIPSLSATPPHLHSFPTRRSSDLARHHGLLGDELTVGVREHAAADGGILTFGVFAHHPEVHIAVGEYPSVGGRMFPDRKSTRLNSSHDQISHAVFCLKKKK